MAWRSSMNRCCHVLLAWPIFEVFSHCTAISWAIHKVIRVFAPECFGDMAAPADGRMGFKNLREFLRRNVGPLNGFPFRVQQCRAMIVPMNLFNWLMAIGAGPAAKPLLHNIPNVAAFRIVFNLAKARLPTVLTFRPARTPVQLKAPWSALCRLQRSPSRINVDRRWAPRLGACDETLPAMAQIGTKHDSERDDCPDDRNHAYENEWNERHTYLLRPRSSAWIRLDCGCGERPMY